MSWSLTVRSVASTATRSRIPYISASVPTFPVHCRCLHHCTKRWSLVQSVNTQYPPLVSMAARHISTTSLYKAQIPPRCSKYCRRGPGDVFPGNLGRRRRSNPRRRGNLCQPGLQQLLTSRAHPGLDGVHLQHHRDALVGSHCRQYHMSACSLRPPHCLPPEELHQNAQRESTGTVLIATKHFPGVILPDQLCVVLVQPGLLMESHALSLPLCPCY